jgi:hypothetical protein
MPGRAGRARGRSEGRARCSTKGESVERRRFGQAKSRGLLIQKPFESAPDA